MLAITQGISEAKLIGWTSEMNQLIQFESDEDIVNFCEWIQIKSKHPCVVVDPQNRVYHSQSGASFERVILQNIDALCQRGSDRKQFEFYFDMESETRRQASVFCIKQAKGLLFLILLFEGEPDDKNIDSLGHMGVELLAHMFDDRENQYQRDAERLLRSLHILKQQGLSELTDVTEFFQIQQQNEYRVAVAHIQPQDCDKLYEKLARKPCLKVVCRAEGEQMILIVDGDTLLIP